MKSKHAKTGCLHMPGGEESLEAISLAALPREDDETDAITAVIETPKGSSNKYDYDAKIGAFRLAGVLPEGSAFPYDFGFIPSTLGEDGDPLDVLVFLDAPIPIGCVLAVRLIGVIEARQREKKGDWITNDRLLAVAIHAHAHAHVQSIDDLRPHLLDEIEAFFRNYNALHGKEFEPLGRGGPKRARRLIDEGAQGWERKHGD